jgi:PIN domain nuclease of toxin-antitoxin system
MPDSFVVDTHALIWFLQGDSHRLSIAANDCLNDQNNRLIVAAEAAHLILRGRTNIPSPQILVDLLDEDNRWRIIPIDKLTVIISCKLQVITELHDRLIVASTLRLIQEGTPVSLITKDVNISSSGVVPVLW